MLSDFAKNLGSVKSNTMADVVEDQLRAYLKKMSFKPGDSLPKENEHLGHISLQDHGNRVWFRNIKIRKL